MALDTQTTELTLGPLYFNWPADRLADFYARIADEAPIERVHLGEVVCGKRSPLTIDAVVAAAERLERAGKTVVWSVLISPVNPRERRLTRELMPTGGSTPCSPHWLPKHVPEHVPRCRAQSGPGVSHLSKAKSFTGRESARAPCTAWSIQVPTNIQTIQ